MIRKGFLPEFVYCYVCCCSHLKMKEYVFVVVVVCLEIRDSGMQSQTIAYAFSSFPPIQSYLRYFQQPSTRIGHIHSSFHGLYTKFEFLFYTYLYAAGRQSFAPESHFIRLNTGKEQKWCKHVLMCIEGNGATKRHDTLPAQIQYVIIIYLTLT